MGKDSRRKWVASELEEGVHALLWEYCTELGEHPTRVIERFVIDGLERVADEAENPSLDLKAFTAVRKAVKEERRRGQLERLAWSVQKYGNESAFDALQSLCEDHGLTTEEIMDAVRDQEHAPIVIQDNGQGITSAMAWLSKIMKDKDEYPSNVIFSMGEAQGFSKPTLKAAKQRLGIVSIRRSRHWSWSFSTNGGKDQGSKKSGNHNPASEQEPF